MLQTADGALSQVTTLLNRAVTLATEASNGGLSSDAVNRSGHRVSASIQTEIDNIGTSTNFNGTAVLAAPSAHTSLTEPDRRVPSPRHWSMPFTATASG